MTTFNAKQLASIIAATKGVAKANVDAQKANDKRMGAYGTFTQLAMDMGSDDFGSAMDHLFESIRANVDGIAKKVGADPTKDGKAWTVPGSMSTAKSVLLGAFEYGVPFEDDHGVRAFGAIRTDVKQAKKAEKDAERTPSEIARDALAAQLRELADGIAKDEPDFAMVDHYDALKAYLAGWVVEQAKIAGEDADVVAALEKVLLAEAA